RLPFQGEVVGGHLNPPCCGGLAYFALAGLRTITYLIRRLRCVSPPVIHITPCGLNRKRNYCR
ncbi:MAG: hypothetical protein LBU34_17605, partial [Planctomycetaceae bacterium]|nr:hypothetical protein [Planctomycetaceae bacterium]